MDMWYRKITSVQPRVRHSLQGGVAWNEEINWVWNELEHWYGRISLEVRVCHEAEVTRCRPGEVKLSSCRIWSTATDLVASPMLEQQDPMVKTVEDVSYTGHGPVKWNVLEVVDKVDTEPLTMAVTDIWQLGKISDH